MATILARLGRFAFKRRGPVVLAWLAILAGALFAGLTAPSVPDDDFSVPGVESQRAFELMQERFPGLTADAGGATVVFVAPEGKEVTSAPFKSAIESAVQRLAGGDQVEMVADPFQAYGVSRDGSAAYASVMYNVPASGVTADSRAQLNAAADIARDAGLTVEAGGSAMESAGGGGTAEIIAISLAAVILMITFGSLVAAGLPLLTALLGVAVSMLSTLAVSDAFGLSATTGTMAMMLGLAVGIDYALFVVSRYREERRRGLPAVEAISLAVGTAGSAVAFAGLTVVIALAGLAVVGIPMLTKMGLAAVAAVVVAVLVALTLVPAVLGFVPEKVLSRSARRSQAAGAGEKSLGRGGTRWARFVLRRPVAVLTLGVVVLGALAIPVTALRLGMPGDESKPTSATERRAYDELAKAFGPGFNGPLMIVVDAGDAADPKQAVASIAADVAGVNGVVSVSPPQFNDAGDTAFFDAVPSTSPTDEATKDLVRDLRDARSQFTEGTGTTFQVTGTTAINIDLSAKLQGALVPYLATVVGLAVLLLLVVFRSILIPLKAALGFLLSVLAALGAMVLVFQEGLAANLLGVEQTGPIMSAVPIFMIGIVFGLAMDYEVFLVSRMREAYVHGEEPRQALETGFRHSARVVVAAALIMMAVFAGFIFEHDAFIKMIGFSLAAAVLLDAFVVRMAIVPAVLALLGHRAWWLPGWLDRIVPRVDIEGESLNRAPLGDQPARPEEPVPASAP
ncbi:RND superfamily putative drug exporter [Kribbella sp. VKM Ac-2527]|uniref:RND superfamily putative drug exporter n=1 Tax=Kribbella caucasensis TaxID=2512215 RepID=A0A4R6KAC2_9ACTN|nr:MMPL family transporter [Kribbella sp. VKM Ac-2527]TDO46745.1 RND superfamily putative drug exporter [Kribbella sp. VKM Ac-2527]